VRVDRLELLERLLVGVALGLAYAPVHEGAFIATVLVLLILSMSVEARTVIRRMDAGTLRR
ncbi:MAG: hypothetical protein BRD30_01265, partial [Bacteroidetes bacterium QH_2_63_10]